MEDVLAVLKEELVDNLKLTYCLGEYDKPKIKYPYIIGEYIENTNTNEDNRKSGQIILSIFTRGTRMELENLADILQEHFKFFTKEKNNSIVSLEYATRLMVDTADKTIKKLEIYLDFNKWKGEN